MARKPSNIIRQNIEVNKNWTLGAELVNRYKRPWINGYLDFLPKPPTLVVPVDVQALFVSENQSEKFVVIPYVLSDPERPSEQAFPKAFSDPQPRPAGIHLHWAMPNGLLRGTPEADGLDFNPLPDQWQVTRVMALKNRKTLVLKSWSVDATTGRTRVLGEEAGANSGVALKADELDAGVGGGIEWTAGYDAAQNRFAMHDDLSDVSVRDLESGTVNYTVIGWWSQRHHDPLSGKSSIAATASVLSQLSLSASDMPVVRGPVISSAPSKFEQKSSTSPIATRSRFKDSDYAIPVDLGKNFEKFTQRIDSVTAFEPAEPAMNMRVLSPTTLLSGSIYGVKIGGRNKPDRRPNASQIEIAMGTSLSSLISAFASKTPNFRSAKTRLTFERLLTAISNDSLSRVGDTDGLIKIDETAHLRTFEARAAKENYTDILKGDGRDTMKYGRPARSRQGLNHQIHPNPAQVIWNSKTRGLVSNTLKEQIFSNAQKYPRRAPTQGQTREVSRRGPRYFVPSAPILGLRNYASDPRIGGFGIHQSDATLSCRWDSELKTSSIDGYDIRDRFPTYDEAFGRAAFRSILFGASLDNPYLAEWSLQSLDLTLSDQRKSQIAARVRAEHMLRFGPNVEYSGQSSVSRNLNSPIADKNAVDSRLYYGSLHEGREASPMEITVWAQPWSPLWLEWDVEIDFNESDEGYTLGMLDYEGNTESFNHRIRVKGRSLITKGLQKDYQAAISNYLTLEAQREETGTGELNDTTERQLAKLLALVGDADVGSANMDVLEAHWLGIDTSEDGIRWQVDEQGNEGPILPHDLPKLLISGALQVKRVRIIDTFGRFRDLNARKTLLSTQDAKTKINSSNEATPSLTTLELPPRIHTPARLLWRFTDPSDQSIEASEATINQVNPTAQINPIAGYLMPDFLDESIEFFDTNGEALGQAIQDPLSGHVTWEIAPLRAGPHDAAPDFDLPPNAFVMGQIAKSLIRVDGIERDQGRDPQHDSPLTALLRVFQSSHWTMGGSGLFSSAAVAGLVGHPIAVVQAKIKLDIPDDIGDLNLDRDKHSAEISARKNAFDALNAKPFPVRLGEISRRNDGLYGYFEGQDFEHLKLVEAEVPQNARASGTGRGYNAPLGDRQTLDEDGLPILQPVQSTYLAKDFTTHVHRNQTRMLTLLMHPYSEINATSGLLPRKSLRLLKDWVAPGLERIAPSARIGPVLIDPDKVRLPKIAAFGENQHWTRRSGPLTWKDDPILAASQAALLPAGKVSIEEGYIRVVPVPKDSGEN